MITLLAVGTRYRPTMRSKKWYARLSCIHGYSWFIVRGWCRDGNGVGWSGSNIANHRERSIYTIDWSKY
jgi:hypothetical protein